MYQVLFRWFFGTTLWDTLYETVVEAVFDIQEHSKENNIDLSNYKIIKVVGEWNNVFEFNAYE